MKKITIHSVQRIYAVSISFMMTIVLGLFLINHADAVPEPPMLVYGTVKTPAGQLLSAGEITLSIVDQSQQVVQQLQSDIDFLRDEINFLARLPMDSGPGLPASNPNTLLTKQNYFIQVSYDGEPVVVQALTDPIVSERGKTVGPLEIVVPVEAGNPPTIVSITASNTNVQVGETVEIQLIAEDLDQDQLQVTTTPAGWLNQVAMLQGGVRFYYDYELTATPAMVGQHQLTFRVSDGLFQTTDSITLTVGQDQTVIQPALVYEFDLDTLNQNGWTEIEGGFQANTPKAAHQFMDYSYDPTLFPASTDDKGLLVTTNPGEVFFAFANAAFPRNNQAIVLRLSARAGLPGSQIALVALKGDVSSGQLDGSIAYHIPFNTQPFMEQAEHLVLLYEPDDANSPITPAIQVASSSATDPGVVLIDRMEVYTIAGNSLYPTELFDGVIDMEPLQASPNTQSSADLVYEFGEGNFANTGWVNMQGGFIPGTPFGFVLPFDFPEGQLVSSQDRKGIAVLTRSGDVNLLYSTEPVQTNGSPVLIRATLQADAPHAQIALIALKGNLSNGVAVDGSIAVQTPASSGTMIANEKTLSLIYYPDSSDLITPAMQVAGIGEGQQTSVYIDRLEVFLLKPAMSYQGELFRSGTLNQ